MVSRQFHSCETASLLKEEGLKRPAASSLAMDEQKEENLSRALSAGSRRQILHLLLKKKRTVKEITVQTGMSMSLVSRHLTLLRDLGLLEVRKEPPHKYYSIKIKGLDRLLEVYDQVMEKL